jgi:hypothetical protein
VKELPANFQPLHIELLSVASYLAKLSPEQLGRDEIGPPSSNVPVATLTCPDLLINPAAHYKVGWSHGKEALNLANMIR